MLSRIFQFHAFEMEPVIKVRYKLRWLLVLLSIAAAAGQPGNPRKVDSFITHLFSTATPKQFPNMHRDRLKNGPYVA